MRVFRPRVSGMSWGGGRNPHRKRIYFVHSAVTIWKFNNSVHVHGDDHNRHNIGYTHPVLLLVTQTAYEDWLVGRSGHAAFAIPFASPDDQCLRPIFLLSLLTLLCQVTSSGAVERFAFYAVFLTGKQFRINHNPSRIVRQLVRGWRCLMLCVVYKRTRSNHQYDGSVPTARRASWWLPIDLCRRTPSLWRIVPFVIIATAASYSPRTASICRPIVPSDSARPKSRVLLYSSLFTNERYRKNVFQRLAHVGQ